MQNKNDFFTSLETKLDKLGANNWTQYQVNMCDRYINIHYQNSYYASVTKEIFKPFLTELKETEHVDDFYFWIDKISNLLPDPSKTIIIDDGGSSFVNIPKTGLWAHDKKNKRYLWCMEKEREEHYIAERGLSAKILSGFWTFGQWANDNNLAIVHSATIGSKGGLLIVGSKGGTGKSTLCARALSQGFQTQGDDYVFLTLEGKPCTYPFYASLNTDNIQVIPAGLTEMRGGDKNKTAWDISQYIINRKTELKAFVSIKNDANGKTWIEPTKRKRAIFNTAASSVSQTSLIRNDDILSKIKNQLMKLPRFTLHQDINQQYPYDIKEIFEREKYIKNAIYTQLNSIPQYILHNEQL